MDMIQAHSARQTHQSVQANTSTHKQTIAVCTSEQAQTNVCCVQYKHMLLSIYLMYGEVALGGQQTDSFQSSGARGRYCYLWSILQDIFPFLLINMCSCAHNFKTQTHLGIVCRCVLVGTLLFHSNSIRMCTIAIGSTCFPAHLSVCHSPYCCPSASIN